MINSTRYFNTGLFRNKFLFALFLLLLPAEIFSQNADIEILRAINSPETLPSDRFFLAVTNSAAIVTVLTPLTMGTVGLIKDDKTLFRNAEVIAGAAIVNLGITSLFKYTINRERPFVTYPDITKKAAAGSPSFPSGHTSMAFATATSLTLQYPKWYVIVPSYGWAGLVGYSRMHLGVHYPSDVLAGAVIGSGSAWLTYWVNKKLLLKKKNREKN